MAERVITFFVADTFSPSARLRILPFNERLRSEGFTTRVCTTIPSKNWRPDHRWVGARLALLAAASVALALQRLAQIVLYVPRSDVIVVQKSLAYRLPLLRLDRLLLLLARWHGTRVVYDVDDAVHVGTSCGARRFTAREAIRTARRSHLVVVGCNELRLRMEERGATVALVPTCAPAPGPMPAQAPRRSETLRLCWTGEPVNLIHFAPLLPALRRLAARLDISLVVVTRPSKFDCMDWAGIDVQQVSWSSAREQLALRTSHIGLAPLDSTPWSVAKCGARVLTYFSAGLPVVASPVGAQRLLVEHHVSGLLADSPAEWLDAIDRIATDRRLHARLAAGGRDVANRLSRRAWYPVWRGSVLG